MGSDWEWEMVGAGFWTWVVGDDRWNTYLLDG